MKIKKEYTPSENAGFGKEKAQIYGEHLDKLQKTMDILTPAMVVNDARDENSPTHSYFEWNNKKASDKYRLHQARSLLNSIKVIIISDDDSEGEIRKFHNIKVKISDDELCQGYVSVNAVLKSGDFLEQIIANALKELIGWKKRYGQYKKLSPIVKAIEKFL